MKIHSGTLWMSVAIAASALAGDLASAQSVLSEADQAGDEATFQRAKDDLGAYLADVSCVRGRSPVPKSTLDPAAPDA